MKYNNKKFKLKENDIVISPLTKSLSIDNKINKRNVDKGKEPVNSNISYSEEKDSIEENSISENDEKSLLHEKSNKNDNVIDILPSAPSIYISREIPMNTDNTNLDVALTETNENTNNNNTTFINNTNTVPLQNPNNGESIDVNSLLAHLDYLHNYILTNIPNHDQAPPSYMNINNNTDSNANNNEQQQQQQEQQQEQEEQQ